jgi:hypothetical protein
MQFTLEIVWKQLQEAEHRKSSACDHIRRGIIIQNFMSNGENVSHNIYATTIKQMI